MDLSGVSTSVLAGAVIFTGLVVVFIVLVTLWLIVTLLGKLLDRSNKPAPTPPDVPDKAPDLPVPTAPLQQPMQIESGIGDEVVAVIAAAIAAMSDGPAVIRSVRQVKQRGARSSWAQAGVIQNTQQF